MPGHISSRSQLDEGYFSAATIVAYLNRPDFDGKITYDKDGFPVTGLGVEVFATGQRNSYDICLHSNGELYATGKLLVCQDSVDPYKSVEPYKNTLNVPSFALFFSVE